MENGKKSAYPVPNYPDDSGLTKREYFAGVAMQGILAGYKEVIMSCKPEQVARKAKEIADELLKQLDEK